MQEQTRAADAAELRVRTLLQEKNAIRAELLLLEQEQARLKLQLQKLEGSAP